MGKRIAAWKALLLLAASAPALAAGGYQQWITSMSCGRVAAQIEASCKPAGPDDDINDCKEEHYLRILKPAPAEPLLLPNFTPAERKRYVAWYKKHPGIFPEYPYDWACVSEGGVKYLRIYFSKGPGDETPFSNRNEYYTESGTMVTDQKLIDRMDQKEWRDPNAIKRVQIRSQFYRPD